MKDFQRYIISFVGTAMLFGFLLGFFAGWYGALHCVRAGFTCP